MILGDKKEKIIGIFKAVGAFFTFKKVKEAMDDPQDYNKSIDAMMGASGVYSIISEDEPIKETAEKVHTNKIIVENQDLALNTIEANAISPIDSDANYNQPTKSQPNSNIDIDMKKFKNLTQSEVEIIRQTYIKYNMTNPESIEYFTMSLDDISQNLQQKTGRRHLKNSKKLVVIRKSKKC